MPLRSIVWAGVKTGGPRTAKEIQCKFPQAKSIKKSFMFSLSKTSSTLCSAVSTATILSFAPFVAKLQDLH